MSSKRHLRRRSCSSKVRHPDQAAAQAAARSLRRDKRASVIAYHCKFCGGWHIGQPSQKIKQSIRASIENK